MERGETQREERFSIRVLPFYARAVNRKVWNEAENGERDWGERLKTSPLTFSYPRLTLRQNVYACARLSISGLFFSRTFQSDQSLPRALGFILCAACGSVVLLHAARVFDYFVVIEIAFMDNQAQITETISRLDSEKVR